MPEQDPVKLMLEAFKAGWGGTGPPALAGLQILRAARSAGQLTSVESRIETWERMIQAALRCAMHKTR